MFRDQVPLPAKVRESGEGYTLSGKPVDPNSAAAKPYLNRGGNISGPKPEVKKEVVVEEKKEDDPMEGVVQDNNIENMKDITEKEDVRETPMEVDAITKVVETQTKELTIGDDDRNLITEAAPTHVTKTKEKKISSKSATPSPSTSSTT
jgi:hypothetical protein